MTTKKRRRKLVVAVFEPPGDGGFVAASGNEIPVELKSRIMRDREAAWDFYQRQEVEEDQVRR